MHIVTIKQFTYLLAMWSDPSRSRRGGFDLLHTRMFWTSCFLVLSPGSFRWLVLVGVIAVNINYLSSTCSPGLLSCLLSQGGSPTSGGLQMPLGVAVSSYLPCLPVVFAEVKEGMLTLQQINELIVNVEACISPSRRSSAFLKDKVEKCSGRFMSSCSFRFWYQASILIFHIA